MCSGKGICDWDTGLCQCYDSTDATPGCYNSPVNKPLDPNVGYHRSTISFLIIATIALSVIFIVQ